MTAAAMESKRLGLCSKSLLRSPEFTSLSNGRRSSCSSIRPLIFWWLPKKDFETKNRKRFCGSNCYGDYDAIIIGHSQFEKIPMSIERQRSILEQQL
jgi:N12 class adenine-specific DNA methylase